MKKKLKNYTTPIITIIELSQAMSILCISPGDGGGELPPNPNYPI